MIDIDDLFEGKVRTSSMMGAVSNALNHNVVICDLCVKQALSWQGTLSIFDRVETLRYVSGKLCNIDKTASQILSEAIANNKPVIML